MDLDDELQQCPVCKACKIKITSLSNYITYCLRRWNSNPDHRYKKKCQCHLCKQILHEVTWEKHKEVCFKRSTLVVNVFPCNASFSASAPKYEQEKSYLVAKTEENDDDWGVVTAADAVSSFVQGKINALDIARMRKVPHFLGASEKKSWKVAEHERIHCIMNGKPYEHILSFLESVDCDQI